MRNGGRVRFEIGFSLGVIPALMDTTTGFVQNVLSLINLYREKYPADEVKLKVQFKIRNIDIADKPQTSKYIQTFQEQLELMKRIDIGIWQESIELLKMAMELACYNLELSLITGQPPYQSKADGMITSRKNCRSEEFNLIFWSPHQTTYDAITRSRVDEPTNTLRCYDWDSVLCDPVSNRMNETLLADLFLSYEKKLALILTARTGIIDLSNMLIEILSNFGEISDAPSIDSPFKYQKIDFIIFENRIRDPLYLKKLLDPLVKVNLITLRDIWHEKNLTNLLSMALQAIHKPTTLDGELRLKLSSLIGGLSELLLHPAEAIWNSVRLPDDLSICCTNEAVLNLLWPDFCNGLPGGLKGLVIGDILTRLKYDRIYMIDDQPAHVEGCRLTLMDRKTQDEIGWSWCFYHDQSPCNMQDHRDKVMLELVKSTDSKVKKSMEALGGRSYTSMFESGLELPDIKPGSTSMHQPIGS
jgi:hypothetical protein